MQNIDICIENTVICNLGVHFDNNNNKLARK